jgi:hypothetical protein
MITKNTFRYLVGAIFFSLFYDLIWFAMNHFEYSYEQKYDGGMETNLRRFSLYFSYASFFIRIIIGIVYWKDSLDFE